MRQIKANILRNKLKLIIVLVLFLALIIANSIFLESRNKQSFQYPIGQDIEEYALNFLKDREREKRGKNIDCSGFTRDVYKHFIIMISHSALKQYKQCTPLSVDNLKKGNLVFFCTNGNSISHVGIFLENGKFIHSPGRSKYVRIDSLSNKYWNESFVSGGKVKI